MVADRADPHIGVIPPHNLGLPVSAWRPGQWETITRIHNSRKPVVILSAPTGAGKSLIAAALAALEMGDGGKTAILTKTIQLQDQYLRDFPDLTRMVGRSNFPCLIGYDHAADAPCTEGIPCDYRLSALCDECLDTEGDRTDPYSGKCHDATHEAYFCPNGRNPESPYYAHRRASYHADSVVLNYDYAMASLSSPFSPMQNRTLLVCDEAHLMDESLRAAAGVAISKRSLGFAATNLGVPPPHGVDHNMWYTWAKDVQLRVDPIMKGIKGADYDTLRQYRWATLLSQVANKLVVILDSPSHAIGKPTMTGFVFEPVFAGAAFRSLMNHTSKVVLMSATLPGPDLTASLLDLKPEKYESIELPSTFPAQQRPVYQIGDIAVTKKMSTEDLDALVDLLDAQIDQYTHTKGIIHTHAYWLQKEVLTRSRHTNRFITHVSRGLPLAVENFKSAPPGTFLVSPTAHSGVDLPYDHVRVQFIMKLPTPDLTDPHVAFRKEIIPETYDQMIAATVIQAAGRAMRSADDSGTTIILDRHWRWWSRKNRKLLPQWFQDAMISYP